MPRVAHIVRRPVIVIWALALIASAITLVALGDPSISRATLAGAAVIAGLLGLGDMAAVELEDRSTLTPSQALLIAGVVVAGWPLLPIAALVGTLLPPLVRRRLSERVFIDAGA